MSATAMTTGESVSPTTAAIALIESAHTKLLGLIPQTSRDAVTSMLNALVKEFVTVLLVNVLASMATKAKHVPALLAQMTAPAMELVNTLMI